MVAQYGKHIGTVTSPNFPHGYAMNGETFTYMIQNLDPYGHVRLKFDDWDVAPQSRVKVLRTRFVCLFVRARVCVCVCVFICLCACVCLFIIDIT